MTREVFPVLARRRSDPVGEALGIGIPLRYFISSGGPLAWNFSGGVLWGQMVIISPSERQVSRIVSTNSLVERPLRGFLSVAVKEPQGVNSVPFDPF